MARKSQGRAFTAAHAHTVQAIPEAPLHPFNCGGGATPTPGVNYGCARSQCSVYSSPSNRVSVEREEWLFVGVVFCSGKLMVCNVVVLLGRIATAVPSDSLSVVSVWFV